MTIKVLSYHHHHHHHHHHVQVYIRLLCMGSETVIDLLTLHSSIAPTTAHEEGAATSTAHCACARRHAPRAHDDVIFIFTPRFYFSTAACEIKSGSGLCIYIPQPGLIKALILLVNTFRSIVYKLYV